MERRNLEPKIEKEGVREIRKLSPCCTTGKNQARKKRDSRLVAKSSKRVKEARKGNNPDVDLAIVEVSGCDKYEAKF